MFHEKEITSLSINPFIKIGEEWMLITAGNAEKCNTMTASWGGLGVLWGKNVSFIFIRESRYTLEFLEAGEYYSLSFFAPGDRAALNYCGSHSGRDGDKLKPAGLTPVYTENAPYFEQAQTAFICRKLFEQKLEPSNFTDSSLEGKNYPQGDYHRMFVGEIVKVLEKD